MKWVTLTFESDIQACKGLERQVGQNYIYKEKKRDNISTTLKFLIRPKVNEVFSWTRIQLSLAHAVNLKEIGLKCTYIFMSITNI